MRFLKALLILSIILLIFVVIASIITITISIIILTTVITFILLKSRKEDRVMTGYERRRKNVKERENESKI